MIRQHQRRMASFRSIALLAIAALVPGCASHYRELAGQIRNEHIVWDGNYMGLRVYAVGQPELRLLQAGPSCRPYVIEALDDESRYVAAHVILTQMESSYSFSPTEWNHLRVVLRADGTVEIPDGQRLEIQKLWMQK